MCGIEVEIRGEQVVAIRGDQQDVLSRGHVCPKVQAIKGVHEDPDRLRKPLRRRGEQFHEVSWDEALDEAAHGLAAVRDRHGAEGIAFYLGNPTVHNYGSVMYFQLLRRALGRVGQYSATSLDQLPHMLAGQLMFGHQLLLPVPDIDRTDFLLMLGANPKVSNGSLMTAGDVGGRFAELRSRGGKLVVVDPRRTETADEADRYLPIRPGTDALLLLALIQEVYRLDAVRPGRFADRIDGLKALGELSAPFTPAAVSGPTGIDGAAIEALAAQFVSARAPVAYGRMGVCTQEFGGLCGWLINALNTITGRLDEPGGAMFATPAADLLPLLGPGSFAQRRTRVRGLPAFGGEWPTAALAEEMDTPGEGQVRALLTSAGNPVLSAPNGPRLEAALPGLDFMVSIDIYRNETTRHADLILPPTFGLEHDHYDLVFHGLAVRNTARYCPPAFERAPDARHDWEIMLGLATRLSAGPLGGPLGRLLDRLPAGARGVLGPSTALDLMLRFGPHTGLNLRKLAKQPRGVDLGPLEPCLLRHLDAHHHGRIQLVPEAMRADVARALARVSASHRDGLVLIGRRELRTHNSWLHNSAKLNSGKRRCTLQMHPDDSGDLTSGQRVRLRTRVGTVEAELEVTDRLMQGVVSLPHGWGHHREGVQLREAAQRPGVSVNDLTDDQRVDPLSGNAAFSAVPVQVEACTE